ncbi:protein translocase subunit SecD [uncultured Pseudoramibacter sp.]|uniref:protein translocase subunit SecD n=1 Tax=uncultured Pseudoramibacter sp. TaxID=1623493 RepID=UPI0025E99940|nr:protein translocase subunit SecD [uncultured Pseudoramibacter sp.]
MKKKINTKSTVGFFAFVAILIFCMVVLFHGISVGVYDIGNIKENMHYGLDLTGGVNVVLQAKPTKGKKLTDSKMEGTVSALKNRVDSLGVSEATVTRQGKKRIRVQIPSIQNQQEALDLIGRTAQLKFVGPDGKTILTGTHVTDSKAVTQKTSSGVEQPVVTLKFDSKGKKAFAEATQKYIGQQITIKLDDEVISSPTVNQAITDGEAVIEGSSDMDEAGNLASLIRGGALPVKLTTVQASTVGPTLGANSLDQSIFAGVIGVAAVLVFMLVFYRGLGIIADLALLVFVMLDLVVMSLMNVTLTLPGIAGMILTIGMAVDANVIIFERIKEESRNMGQSLSSSVNAGFKNAMRSIVDSNVTTLIAGFVLFFMGTGSAQGFALTLVVGIILSMFTAVVVTRQLIKLFLNTNLIQNPKFYGI